MPVDAQLAPLLQMIEAGTPMNTLTPAEARDAFRKLTVDFRPPGSLPEVASVEDGTVAGAEGPLPARVYRPAADGPVPTVVLLHGGGFVIGDLDTHEAMARAICKGTDSVVVAVDYRLAPEAKFPAAAEDAVAAVRDVQARLGEYGGSEVIAAQLLVYPATDVLGAYASRDENATGYFLDQPTLIWFIGHYADTAEDLDDPRISPLHGKLEGQPPAVVVTAEFDPLRDEGIAYADALAAAGVRVHQTTYPGLIHGFFDMGPWSAACQQAIDETIARFGELLRAR